MAVFLLHRHLKEGKPPSAEESKKVCPRYAALAGRIAAERGKLTTDFIKENHRAVNPTGPAPWFGLKPPSVAEVVLAALPRRHRHADFAHDLV